VDPQPQKKGFNCAKRKAAMERFGQGGRGSDGRKENIDRSGDSDKEKTNLYKEAVGILGYLRGA
jgi:hypothetical protein